MLKQIMGVGDSNIPGIFVNTKEELEREWNIHGTKAVYLTSCPNIHHRIKCLGGACIYLEKQSDKTVNEEDEEKVPEKSFYYDADYIWQMTENADYPDEQYIYRIWQRHMHLPWLIAETKHLIIRESVMEDLPYFQKFYEEEKDNPDVQTLNEDAQEQLLNYITIRYPLFEYGLWTIVDKTNGRVLGRAGIEELPEIYNSLAGEPELSYLIGREYRERGIATEACQTILRYAAEELEMEKIYLRTSKENHLSQKLAEKLGLLKVESITEYKDLLYCGLLTFEG